MLTPEEEAAAALKAKEANGTPAPVKVDPAASQPNASSYFLDEWNAFKKEINWVHPSLRKPPEVKPGKEKAKKEDCCILFPYCHCPQTESAK